MKRILALALSVLMAFAALPFAAYAEETCTHEKYEWVYHGGENQTYDCTRDTVYRYKKCLSCSERISQDTTISVQTRHSFMLDRESSTAPDCNSTGIDCYRCAYCTVVKRETVPSLVHKWSEYYVNKVCFEDGTNTPGELIRFCDRCGKAETKTILNHTYFITEGKEASCFSAGITDVKYCNVCGTYSVAAEIPKLEHEDKNKDNKCDLCFSPIVFNGKFCGCICHNEKPFFQKIMPIIVFIWKLLGIDSCPCGTVHY